ncbi:hypothetical protein CR513_45962, partial [Mucuna pruriens]
MPLIVFIFFLDVPLSADLKNLVIFNLYLHILLLQPGNISLEHMRFWSLLPVHLGAHKRRIFRERKILEGVPHVQRERVGNVAPSTTEETWDQDAPENSKTFRTCLHDPVGSRYCWALGRN